MKCDRMWENARCLLRCLDVPLAVGELAMLMFDEGRGEVRGEDGNR